MKTKDKSVDIIQSADSISNDIDFWADAREFLNKNIPANFNEKMTEYIKDKNYNQNEFRLFKSMLEEAIGFHGTIVLLNHYK